VCLFAWYRAAFPLDSPDVIPEGSAALPPPTRAEEDAVPIEDQLASDSFQARCSCLRACVVVLVVVLVVLVVVRRGGGGGGRRSQS
jgi:hypothetical protein